MITSLSENINVTTTTSHLAEQSVPEDEKYVFSYTITISNEAQEAVTLLSRRWEITDSNGENTVVEGEGVVGQTPNILPQSSYTYTSGSLFKTPVGTMQGHYKMQTSNGEIITVEIPVFRLSIPNILN